MGSGEGRAPRADGPGALDGFRVDRDGNLWCGWGFSGAFSPEPTDVGGGTNYSMLRTMDEGYKVIALNGEKLNPLASFWQVTLGNAQALSLDDRIGTLDVGTVGVVVHGHPQQVVAGRGDGREGRLRGAPRFRVGPAPRSA